jgi:hypothetical protein
MYTSIIAKYTLLYHIIGQLVVVKIHKRANNISTLASFKRVFGIRVALTLDIVHT